jgi:hypothetical protein
VLPQLCYQPPDADSSESESESESEAEAEEWRAPSDYEDED